MASSAIPFIFPGVYINREYFGDGSMRQLAPISPAIHLGAEKILIIGVGQLRRTTGTAEFPRYPTLAQIAGHALSSIFLDSLALTWSGWSESTDALANPGGVAGQRRHCLRSGAVADHQPIRTY
jgi:predicted acylesterase/phospholipase RssA